MHVRMKSHLTKFYKKKQTRYKIIFSITLHNQNSHGGVREGANYEYILDYKKPLTRQTEEGTFMVNVKEKLLNSKTEWHQQKSYGEQSIQEVRSWLEA